MNGFVVLALHLLKVSALSVGSLAILAIVLALIYGGLLLRRPARTAKRRSLFQGIQYERYARQLPRPLLFHIITIDVTAPGLKFLVTPQGIDPRGEETLADTVPGFLEKQGVQAAINGNFFLSPSRAYTVSLQASCEQSACSSGCR